MGDYISREALVVRLNKNLSACNPGTFSEMCYADAIETVKHFPSADVEPVRHGRWEYIPATINTLNQVRCSVCNWWTLDPSVSENYNYCPKCGVKMQGLEDENHEN